ncbi:cache domain-containing protein [Paenibacillus sonchi]|uniref:Cache domain-containing protein n=1 Tax=Paenibacillus sonchi TaxID=373687 RepID=A0A974PC41_9BACL|nr:cache domain-containing protein [Paenibacillus sonchi]QQZ61294.1 cache domain-containing protein [Paenibacillus sonchi]
MDKKHRSYHPYRSLNFKLLFIFFIATLIPVMGTTYIIAKLYIANYSKDQDILVRNTLVSISQNITTYLKELDQLTLTPYFNDDFIYALKVKANDSFDTSTDKYQVVRINNLLSSQLSFVRNIRKDILSTLMVSHNKILFYSSNNPEDSIADNFAFQDQEWYHKALQARGNAVFIEPHRLDYLKNEQSITAFSVVRAINDLKTHKPIGIIKSDANTIIFDKMFEELQFHVSSNIILMDQNKHVIYAKNRVSDSLLQQINDHPDGSVQDNKESYRVISKSLETYDWRLYILLSSTEIQQKANWIYLISLSFLRFA